MADQKIENLLELALDTPEQTREKSENLSAGYDTTDNLWEVIIRYSGDIGELDGEFTQVTPLLGGYAILRLSEAMLETLSSNPQVEYIEKPKALSFTLYEGKLASCIPPVQREPYNLSGKGILVAVIDSGIDLFHPDFRNEDGTTRLTGLWDQTLTNGTPPMGYPIGRYFDREEINTILETGETSPSTDVSGHGTHVTGIAAGNGRASRGEQRGVAYEADILVVKLRGRSRNGFPQTTELMMGIDFCVRKAIELSIPLALNLSYGNNYGAHDGTSLLETYLDSVAGVGRTTICIGSGNEGNQRRHAAGRLTGDRNYLIEFAIAPGESSLGIQIWKNYVDDFQISLTSPSGSSVIFTEYSKGPYRSVLDSTEILWYFGEPSPYSTNQEIYLEMLPEGIQNTIRSGIWKLSFMPKRIADGRFNIWLPSGSSINAETGFLVPTVENTLTIPSTASKPITVGAYDSNTGSFANFSGQGALNGIVRKPDIAAPGVNILSCAPGGGYTAKSGTSMACPFVTGSAALLMQYGIVQGQDPFLFGEKIKAYLAKGAKPLTAYSEYPNENVGWGALCLRNSLPR
ncbi:MAG: S8 family serine peptidase [Lachnospiraceae bacterium]|nr:S8 family serine peptidase [Lachnospiraceae bacterium]